MPRGLAITAMSNSAVTLVNSGEIQFDYGPGNANLTPTIGISAGDGFNFDLAQYDGQSNLGNANSLSYTLVPGFVDLGAFEFQGNSADTTPPTVTAVQPAGIFAAGTINSHDQFDYRHIQRAHRPAERSKSGAVPIDR